MSKQIRIGVYLSGNCQLLDVATVDVLAVLSQEHLGLVPMVPPQIKALAPSVSVVYIATPELKDEVRLTASMRMKPDHTYLDAEVAPGNFDIIVVPGPDPTKPIDVHGAEWLKKHFERGDVDVLSVCTGLYVCATAGIADGRDCSGPKDLQEDLRNRFPEIKLVGHEYRWVQDGNFWSSGGITNGNDLMAAFARSGKHWERPLVEAGLKLTDVGDRERVYKE